MTSSRTRALSVVSVLVIRASTILILPFSAYSVISGCGASQPRLHESGEATAEQAAGAPGQPQAAGSPDQPQGVPPETVEAVNTAGRAMDLIAEGRHSESAAAFQEAYAKHPDPAPFWLLGLATAQQGAGDLPGAVETLKRYLSLPDPPREALARRRLAETEEALSRRRELEERDRSRLQSIAEQERRLEDIKREGRLEQSFRGQTVPVEHVVVVPEGWTLRITAQALHRNNIPSVVVRSPSQDDEFSSSEIRNVDTPRGPTKAAYLEIASTEPGRYYIVVDGRARLGGVWSPAYLLRVVGLSQRRVAAEEQEARREERRRAAERRAARQRAEERRQQEFARCMSACQQRGAEEDTCKRVCGQHR